MTKSAMRDVTSLLTSGPITSSEKLAIAATEAVEAPFIHASFFANYCNDPGHVFSSHYSPVPI